MLSDGDTVPATGMPKMPASVADVLIVGVGDPRAGSFIDGQMSRQDTNTLRQIAARLGGIYHDGNQKHLSTELLSRLTVIPRKSAFERLTRREYALIACGLGCLRACVLACAAALPRNALAARSAGREQYGGNKPAAAFRTACRSEPLNIPTGKRKTRVIQASEGPHADPPGLDFPTPESLIRHS